MEGFGVSRTGKMQHKYMYVCVRIHMYGVRVFRCNVRDWGAWYVRVCVWIWQTWNTCDLWDWDAWAYIYTLMHTYTHTQCARDWYSDNPSNFVTETHAYIHTHIYTYMHTYIHTQISTCIYKSHSYIHTYSILGTGTRTSPVVLVWRITRMVHRMAVSTRMICVTATVPTRFPQALNMR
jgi:hypothetical protein